LINAEPIAAPFAGVVMRRDAEPGDLASANHVLFVVADESALRITTDLDERDIARVAERQRTDPRGRLPRSQLRGYCERDAPQGDAATRVFRVRLGLAADTPLHAGMTVEVNIITGQGRISRERLWSCEIRLLLHLFSPAQWRPMIQAPAIGSKSRS